MCSHLHRKWQGFCDIFFGTSICNKRLVSFRKSILNVYFINRIRYPINEFESEIESVMWIVWISSNYFVLRCVILVLFIKGFLFSKIHLSSILFNHLFYIRHKRKFTVMNKINVRNWILWKYKQSIAILKVQYFLCRMKYCVWTNCYFFVCLQIPFFA